MVSYLGYCPIMRLVTSVREIVYHRNGVGGEGFWAVRFLGPDDQGNENEFLGIVFEEPRYCAILSMRHRSRAIDVDGPNFTGFLSMAETDIPIGVAWRGDRYEPELREAIAQYEAEVMQNLTNRKNEHAP